MPSLDRKKQALLLACATDVDPREPRQAAWLGGRLDAMVRALEPDAILIAEACAGDEWLRARLAAAGARVLFYHPHHVRQEYVGGRRGASVPWDERVADLAMVRDLVAALGRGWEVYVQTFQLHDDNGAAGLRPLYTFLEWHKRPGLCGNPELYEEPTLSSGSAAAATATGVDDGRRR